MSEEERLKLENELLFTKSKAQMINLYLDKLQELDQHKNNWEELKKWLKEDKELAGYNFEMGRHFNIFDILDKMKELEEKNGKN